MRAWFILAASFFVHIIFFISIFDIYFTTTLVNGTTPHASRLPAKAKRCVFIIADGLRADKFFEIMPNGSSPAPFLRSVIEKEGAWGVSHAAVPTATRPGHVAITAGFYEDPTSVAKDLQGKTIMFDTVFNESRYTWSWDTPDFLGSVTKGHEDRMFSKKYPGDMKWLAGLDAGAMDSWVFAGVHELFENARKSKDLDQKLNLDKIVFFLHLGGLDHSGYIVRPNSDAYLKHITLVDNGVRKLVDEFNSYFNNDDKTAFVFTSDHGMTDWGAHGDGTPEETLTPLVVWGPGIRKPSIENVMMNNPLSKAWKLDNIKRTDIKQASMAALVTAIIGIPFPMHSIFPVPEYLFDISDQEKAEMLFANFQQLLDQYRQTRDKRETESLRFSFTPFKALSEEKAREVVKNIETLITDGKYKEAIDECKRKINLALDGLHYYRTYDRMTLWFSITASYVGWIIYLITILVQEKTDANIKKTCLTTQPSKFVRTVILLFFAILTIVVFTILYLQSVVWVYYLYILLPIPIWLTVILRYNFIAQLFYLFSAVVPLLPYIGLTFLGLELIIASFYQRGLIALGLFFFGLWPWVQKMHLIEKPILFQWLASCLTVSFFPMIPSADRNLKYNLVVFSGILVIAVACLLVKKFSTRALAKRKLAFIFGFQIITIAISTIIVRHTAQMAAADMRTPLLNQACSWTILGLGIIEPFLVSTDLRCRLLTIALAWISPYILLSISHESLFILCMCWNLYIWMVIEFSLSGADDEKIAMDRTLSGKQPSEESVKVIEKLDFVKISNELSYSKTPRRYLVRADLRRGYYFVFMVIGALFGTGNIASVNSFDPAEVFCFLTKSVPVFMGLLIIFKMVIPGLMVGCVLRAIMLLTQMPQKQFYVLVILMLDVMGMQFFFLVNDTGTWYEIGSSISHYVIFQVCHLVFLVLFVLSHLLTTCKTSLKFLSWRPKTTYLQMMNISNQSV